MWTGRIVSWYVFALIAESFYSLPNLIQIVHSTIDFSASIWTKTQANKQVNKQTNRTY